jgi:hypothetical protein
MALQMKGQVRVAEANISAVALGRTPTNTYKAKTGNPIMAVSLGSRAGVAFIPPGRLPVKHGFSRFPPA